MTRNKLQHLFFFWFTNLLFGLACVIVSPGSFSQAFAQYDSTSIHLADPTIFHYNNTFYLYGTVEGNAGKGFLVYTSNDLKNWKLHGKNDGYALRKGDAFGTSGFWAPQVFRHDNKFYMAYTANENIAIAESDHPAGPFKQKILQSLPAPVRQIDPFVFIDDDGKKYLYHVRLLNGNRIFVAELNDDFMSVKEWTLKECISAMSGWENTANTAWPVAEGPGVFKRNNMYYLLYSANDFRNPDYAVGYATSNYPAGPWTRYQGNPILNKYSTGNNGSGHGDFLLDKDRWLYVFHTHNSNSRVIPRRTAIISMAFQKNRNGIDSLTMDTKSFNFLKR